MMKFLKFFFTVWVAVLSLASCNCDHNLEPPAPFKVGWVVCTDGEILPFCDWMKSGKPAVGIVYWVNPDHDADISGYAVYMNDLDDSAFSETEMVAQGTSTDTKELDGNENTWALHSNEEVVSPLAQNVFALWTYGQSAYIPSVAQMRQIIAVRDFINPRLEGIGGDALPLDADKCWYWTSTEVNGQEEGKAWLFSMQSGDIRETPKIQAHKGRPVITIYKQKS